MAADGLRAKVLEDRTLPGAWRVEKMDKDGVCEAFAIFAGPNGHQNAIDYARQLCGTFDEIALDSVGNRHGGG
jgi:hypothetical protein